MRPLTVYAALVLTLSACAARPSPLAGTAGGPTGPPPGLFVSPFGEVFMSGPGEAWPTAAWLNGADTDADGRLTLEEFTADGNRFFAALDLGSDGRIGPEEIVAYERGLAAARGRMPVPGPPGMRPVGPPGGFPEGFPGGMRVNGDAPQQMPGGGGGMPGGGMPGGAGGRLPPPGMPRMRAPTGPLAYGPIAAAGFFNYPQPIKVADLDMNQTITAQEWSLATERWFVALDVDRDGFLSLETLPRTPLQQILERRSR